MNVSTTKCNEMRIAIGRLNCRQGLRSLLKACESLILTQEVSLWVCPPTMPNEVERHARVA